MPQHETTRHVRHTPEQMFALVADVERYPEFLPLCQRLVIQSEREKDGRKLLVADMTVAYKGILPDLFREGQGVIATGTLENGVFAASEVLARHDESYMPKEVADALKEQGLFRYGAGVSPDSGS